MSGLKRHAVFAGIAIAGAAHIFAAPPDVRIRLSTIAPQNSTWHNALTDMGAAWAKATDKRVTLTVFAGSTDGGETKIVKSMRPDIGDNEAALLMVAGLSEIDKAFSVFGMPFFYQSDEEALYVQQKLTPVIAQRLAVKGYHLLNWGSGGWVQVFSRVPLKTLADVKNATMYTSNGDSAMVDWYRKNGFKVKALNANDIGPQLSSGAIDSVPIPPYAVLALKLHQFGAKFMLDLHVAPLVGATVITNVAWNKISADDQAKMTAAAMTMEATLRTGASKQDDDSVKAMQVKGLTVTKLDAANAGVFHTEAEKALESMKGPIVPEDIYLLAVKERDAFRKSKGK